MLANRFGNDLFQLPDTDNISEKKIGDDKSQQKKNDMLQCNQSDLPGIPGCFGQHFLFVGAAYYQVFHFPEKHFHKNGLRTNPSTEQPSECCGKEDDEKNKSQQLSDIKIKIARYSFKEIPAVLFGNETNFYILLRPDNHISYIGKEVSKCREMLEKISFN